MTAKKVSVLFALTLLILSQGNTQESSGKLEVVTEQANIRLEPDIGSTIIHQAPQGTMLESTSKQGEWYQPLSPNRQH